MRRNLIFGLVALAIVGVTGQSHATPVNIIGYDILNADVSGTGSWSHTYTGTITPTSGTLADYSGGTGTMADGVFVGTTGHETQLFLNVGQNVSITLFFDQAYTINVIDIYGGDHGASGNSIPGALTGFDIDIGGTIQSIVTTEFGALSTSSNQSQRINDRADLTATALSSIAASSITLFDFTSFVGLGISTRFSVAEFVIDGDSVAVPEPAALALFAVGLVGLGLMRRRRRS